QRMRSCVRRWWEHIGRPAGSRLVSMLGDEDLRIARERGRMTRYVDDPPRLRAAELSHRDLGAGPRGIEHGDVPALAIERPVGIGEIRRDEARVRNAVAARVRAAACGAPGIALHA